jgi:protein TonB
MEQKKSSAKDYRKRSPQFFLIGLIVALSTTLLAFEYRTSDFVPPKPVDVDNGIVYEPEIMKPITLPVKKTPSPAPKKKPSIVEPKPQVEPLLVFKSTKHKVEVITTDTSLWEPEPYVPEDIPLDFVEVMPSFKGGEAALYKFLGKNMHFPDMANSEKKEAKIYVKFIVNRDGSVSSIKVFSPDGYGFEREVRRVFDMMPDWNPGRQAGRNVRVNFGIPIIFTLM